MKLLNYVFQDSRTFGKRLSLVAIIVVSVVLWMATASAEVASAASARLAYWRLDEASGTTYADAEGGHDGACTACPVATANGQVNGAQTFNGSDAAIDVAAHADFDWSAGDTFSVEAWVQPNACSGGNEVFVGRGSSSSGEAHWSLGCTETGEARFELNDGSFTSPVQVDSAKVIGNDVWHHLVGVYDGANDQAYLYVDGQQDGFAATSFSGNFAQSGDDLNFGHLQGSFHFDGVLDEVAIYDGVALPAAEIGTHYYLSRAYDSSCSASVAIMPLGDSITQGSHSGVADETMHVSYRKDLWQSLFNGGYDVDFVGSQTNGEYYQPRNGFDPDHEGYPGWRDHEIAANVQAWLNDAPADVVLLHIGTNDFRADGFDPTDVTEVENILEEIDAHSEKTTVLLARIIKSKEGYEPVLDVTTFNDNVEAMAEARIAAGDKIIMVNMETGAGIDYSAEDDDMWNYLHPFATGYAKMAALWQTTLAGFMPTCETAPEITSSPVATATANEPFTFQVEATGQPAPVFSLDTAPADMTINAATGEITWTPSSGTQNAVAAIDMVAPAAPQAYIENVVVRAENSTSSDTQSFSITVEDAAPQAVDSDPVGACHLNETNLIGYWTLNEDPAATTFADSSGNGNDATCSGTQCPAPAAGQIGGAQSFSEADGERVSVAPPSPDIFDFAASESFSISYWMKSTQNCTGVDLTDNKVHVGRRGAGFWVGCSYTNGAAAFFLNGTSSDTLIGSTPLFDDAWHHIVAVREADTGAGGEDSLYLYVDGSLEDSVTNLDFGEISSTEDLNIGWFDIDPWFYYDGLLDDIAIYRSALSGGEVGAIYNNGNGAGVGIGYDTAWTGAVDNDWATDGNWTNNAPSVGSDAAVLSGMAQLNANSEVNCLAIGNGSDPADPTTEPVVDLGTWNLTVEDTLTSEGILRQTKANVSGSTEFLYITDSSATPVTKYRGVALDPVSSLGNVTVSVREIDLGVDGEYCTNDLSSPSYADRCFEISPDNTGVQTTVRLYALNTTDALNNIAAGDLAVFRYDTTVPGWSELTPPTTGPPLDGYAYAEGDTANFSAFLLGETGVAPTAVHLNDFQAWQSTYLEALLPFFGLLLMATVLLLRRRRNG